MELETKRTGVVLALNTSMALILTDELKKLGINFSDEVDVRVVYSEGQRVIELRQLNK